MQAANAEARRLRKLRDYLDKQLRDPQCPAEFAHTMQLQRDDYNRQIEHVLGVRHAALPPLQQVSSAQNRLRSCQEKQRKAADKLQRLQDQLAQLQSEAHQAQVEAEEAAAAVAAAQERYDSSIQASCAANPDLLPELPRHGPRHDEPWVRLSDVVTQLEAVSQAPPAVTTAALPRLPRHQWPPSVPGEAFSPENMAAFNDSDQLRINSTANFVAAQAQQQTCSNLMVALKRVAILAPVSMGMDAAPAFMDDDSLEQPSPVAPTQIDQTQMDP